jgi:NTE family protein
MQVAIRGAVLLLLVLGIAGSALAQQAPRPRIGLVLGGGGARGAAHIGVIEVLEELNVPVDCIAGTSMGALVGGAYAAGVTTDVMRKRIAETDWNEIFNDSPERDSINLRRKQLDSRLVSGLEFGVKDGGIRFREGAVAGEKIKLFFNELVGANLGERNIEQLSIPLSIIATDIGRGERVVLKQGSLTLAMRASMSVPGFMVPINIGNRKLVDGGLVDNVPIREARERCADIVIAVDVGTPLLSPEEVTGVGGIATQVVNILTNQNVAASLAALKPEDIFIQPDLGDLSATDLTRLAEGVLRGRVAASKVAAKLRSLSLAPEEFREWQKKLRGQRMQLPVVDEIRIAEMKRVNPEAVRRHLSVREGEPLDSKKLNDDLVRLYGDGDFQNIDYAVVSEHGKNILRLTPVEKPWGPDYLRFGLNLTSDFSQQRSAFNLRTTFQRTWMNSLGAEWLSTLQIGQENLFATEWYQPLNARQLWFAQPAIAFSNRLSGLFADGNRIADYRINEGRLALELGANLGVNGQIKAGWLERRINSRVVTGFSQLPTIEEHIGGPTFNVTYDSLDQAYFPSRGYTFNAKWLEVRRGLNAFKPYSRLDVEATAAWSWGNSIVNGTLRSADSIRGVLPAYDALSLGGPLRLSGFAPDQLLGDEVLFGRLTLQQRLYQASSFFGTSVYAGASAEAGRMGVRFTEPNLSGWQSSYSVYLAANTFLGPVYFGYGYAPNGRSRWYLFLGTP